MQPAQSIPVALRKPLIPVLFFFGGVTFDTLTLTRIDRLSDNLILLTYLGLLGALIVLKARSENASNTTETTALLLHRPAIAPSQPRALSHPPDPEPAKTGSSPRDAALSHGPGSAKTDPFPMGPSETAPSFPAATLVERTRSYYPMAIQFLLGGLFSAYAIFYSRSASFTGTAVFFLLLVALLIGNEFLRDRISNLKLMLALYALATCSFLTFFLPVVTGIMNTGMFLIGPVLSAVLAVGIVRLVYRGRIRSRWEPIRTAFPAILVVGVVVAFYFLNWIPPVPLSMSFGGVYHKVARSGDVYELTFEQPPWYRFWQRSDDPFRGQQEAHCFTAIFAPVDLRAEIYHHWQHRQGEGAGAGRFVTTDRIRVAIVGGRQGGYRAFTVKQHVLPGTWRVDVETAGGRIIGRVSFRVEASNDPLTFKTIFY